MEPFSAEDDPRLSTTQYEWRSLFAVAFLGLFVLAGTVGGFLVSPMWGCIALSVTSLVATYLLGAS